MSTGSSFLGPLTRIPSGSISTSTPAPRIFNVTASKWSGSQFLSSTSPRVKAAATMNVPASIRSATMA